MTQQGAQTQTRRCGEKRAAFSTILRGGIAVLAATTLLFSVRSSGADGNNHNGYNNHKGNNHSGGEYFRRIASFPVYLNEDIDTETVAEIVAVSKDGKLLIYTDSEQEKIGFVDITNPHDPQPKGVLPVGGEPTSVAVAGKFALVAVNTSPDFVSPSGELKIVDLDTLMIVRELPLGGQPDSVAVSPDKRYAAIVIENERDEDLDDGEPPQAPPGFLVIVDIVDKQDPVTWTLRTVDFVGVPTLFPDDPEPEFVDINKNNIAAVSLQENNHMILVHLPSGNIVQDWSTGLVDLDEIDTLEDELIELNSSLFDVPREVDAVAWISASRIATANEGDLFGGSRGFSLFNKGGNVKFDSGNEFEHLVARVGHFPEDRAENKGSEPESVEFGRYDGKDFLFVGSERSNVVGVYRVVGPNRPEFRQVLPTGLGPEGLLAIPKRNLLVASSENDSRDDGYRALLTIYELMRKKPTYPTIKSVNRPDGTPIPWGALSGLVADNQYSKTLYGIYDSFYKASRIFEIDADKKPAVIKSDLVLKDTNDVLIDALNSIKTDLENMYTMNTTANLIPANFINGDQTVNLDPEGVAMNDDGTFWVASEGAGNLGFGPLIPGENDPASRPFESPNLLIKVDINGDILKVVSLPTDLIGNQLRFGFEGVAVVGNVLYVVFQREWTDAGDPDNFVRIGRYDGSWTFAYYPLQDEGGGGEDVQNGGWIGLSELTHLGGDDFAVVERDNQAGTDARVKRIYEFSIDGVTFAANPSVPTNEVPKTFVRDLIPDLTKDNGPVLEKVEGMAVNSYGKTYIVTDNDGVSDSTGETQFINLGGIFNGGQYYVKNK